MGDPFLHGFVFAEREAQESHGAIWRRICGASRGVARGRMERADCVELRTAPRPRRGAWRHAASQLRRSARRRWREDFNEERRRTANREIFEKLRERYQVSVDEAALTNAVPATNKFGPTMKRWFAIALLLAVVRVTAHEVRPAFLELTERAPGEFDVLWKVPAMGGAPLAGEEIPHEQPASVDRSRPRQRRCHAAVRRRRRRSFRAACCRFIRHCRRTRKSSASRASERLFGAEIKRWTIRVPHGLEGWEVTVHGLSATMVDVLVRVAFQDGRVVSRMLRPDAPSFVFTKETAGPAAGGYFVLGVEHILLGIDHLLFVLALVLIVRGVGLLVKTITAFTIAHSITLALATLGFVNVPSAPVEAVIALSIVFVASEILRSRRGRARADRARAVAGRGCVRIAARVWLCRCVERGRPARQRHPARAALFQCRRRGRATRVCRCGARRHRAAPARAIAGMGADPSALCHWRRRDVLGHRTNRRHLVKPTFSVILNSTLTNHMKTKALAITIATALAISFTAFAADEAGHATSARSMQDKAGEAFKKRPYSPYADRKFPMKPLFGDTHLHTGFSMDAGAFGCRLTPRDAYRFARGEQIMASSGQPAKLSRPLDFLVVADHSDNMGFITDLIAGKPELLNDPTGRQWYDMIQSGKGQAAALEIIGKFSQGKFPKALEYAPGTKGYRGAWQETIDAAEALQRSRPLHRLHRLRVDLAQQGQQLPSQRHLPRQRRQGQPGRAYDLHAAAWAASIRWTCGNGWRCMKRKPAAASSPSRTTAT